jgi:hypothetical protein
MMSNSATRIPIKLHRNVSLLRASDPLVIEEVLARKPLARLVVGRLSDTVVLVRPEDEEALIEELRRLGHTPRLAR